MGGGKRQYQMEGHTHTQNWATTVMKCLNSFLAFVVAMLFPARLMSSLDSLNYDIVNRTTAEILVN